MSAKRLAIVVFVGAVLAGCGRSAASPAHRPAGQPTTTSLGPCRGGMGVSKTPTDPPGPVESWSTTDTNPC